MIQKSKSVALHTVRYGENSLIAYLYTQEFGRVSLMVNSAYGKGKGTKKAVYFQPLNIIDVVFYPGRNQGMGRLKEVSVSKTNSFLHINMVKSALAVFLGEIVYRTVKEEESNSALFQFLELSILSLEAMDNGVANFHLIFLTRLSKYLGFYPSGEYTTETPFFDCKSGQFVKVEPFHPIYFNQAHSQLLSKLLQTDYANAGDIALNGNQRNNFLNQLLNFYAYHMDSVHSLKSLLILTQLFTD
ncbi:MAG: DNA repair protein RecO [Bacteroidales bacterium]